MITRRIGRTQKVKLGAGRIALYKYRNRKAGQGAGAVLSAPPVPESLLIWLKGISTDTQKTDSWAKPDAENFDIKQSNCIYVNGIDEKLSMPDMPSDATITYQGTAVAVVNTIAKEITFTTEGTFYDLSVWTDL